MFRGAYSARPVFRGKGTAGSQFYQLAFNLSKRSHASVRACMRPMTTLLGEAPQAVASFCREMAKRPRVSPDQAARQCAVCHTLLPHQMFQRATLQRLPGFPVCNACCNAFGVQLPRVLQWVQHKIARRPNADSNNGDPSPPMPERLPRVHRELHIMIELSDKRLREHAAQLRATEQQATATKLALAEAHARARAGPPARRRYPGGFGGGGYGGVGYGTYCTRAVSPSSAYTGFHKRGYCNVSICHVEIIT